MGSARPRAGRGPTRWGGRGRLAIAARLLALPALLPVRRAAGAGAARSGSASSWEGELPCLADCPTISKRKLERHGPDGQAPPYVAVLGHALNASGGEQFYAAGGHYAFLAGRDATRAFALGQTSAGVRTEDISDLGGEKVKAALLWLRELAGKYRFEGVVAGGHFYDERGSPTPAMRLYLERLRQQKSADVEKEQWNRQFPRCNVDRGGVFWCGVQRGTPMWLLQPGREERERRCGCVREPAPRPIVRPIFQPFPDCWWDDGKYKCKLRLDGPADNDPWTHMEL